MWFYRFFLERRGDCLTLFGFSSSIDGMVGDIAAAACSLVNYRVGTQRTNKKSDTVIFLPEEIPNGIMWSSN